MSSSTPDNGETNQKEQHVEEDKEKRPTTSSDDSKLHSHKESSSFFRRPIKVKNPEQIDHSSLIQSLLERSKAGYLKWRNRAKVFHFAHVVITIFVIIIQVSQIILFQVPGVSLETQSSLAAVFPALTGAALAFQLRLAWVDKGHKCKKAAKLYKQLTKHLEYRREMLIAGGQTDDVDSVKLWNTALLSENSEVPAYLSWC